MTGTFEAVARAHKLLGKLPRSDFDDVLALLATARESERAAVVVWLRDAPATGAYSSYIIGREYRYIIGREYREEFATAIEAGEHLK